MKREGATGAAEEPERWQRAHLVVALVVAAVIMRLLWTPSQRAHPSFWIGFFCNGGHAFLFAMQTWPLLTAAPTTRAARSMVFVLVLAWAALTEWVQLSVGRDGSVGDFVTDACGVYFAWATVSLVFSKGRGAFYAAHAGAAVVLATLSALLETLS